MHTIEMQKITVEVPKSLLDAAKTSLGKGNSEVIRMALREMIARHAQRDLLALRGTLKEEELSIEDMRSWED